jgi:hypothetical protein
MICAPMSLSRSFSVTTNVRSTKVIDLEYLQLHKHLLEMIYWLSLHYLPFVSGRSVLPPRPAPSHTNLVETEGSRLRLGTTLYTTLSPKDKSSPTYIAPWLSRELCGFENGLVSLKYGTPWRTVERMARVALNAI